MECLDELVIYVDVREIIELLEHEVAWIVEQAGAGMITCSLPEAFERHTVVQVLSGMYLIADIDPDLVECVENRFPAIGELPEAGLDKPGGSLWPGIHGVPEKGA